MYKFPKLRIDWNSSHCNPFNMEAVCHDKNNIPPQTILISPETPYIRGIKSIETTPFINVEKLRTPIDNIIVTVRTYDREDGVLESSIEYITFRYQVYIPAVAFTEEKYHIVTCVAVNEAGTSPVSNEYIVDMTEVYEVIIPPECIGQETYFLDCDLGFCCADVYVCED